MSDTESTIIAQDMKELGPALANVIQSSPDPLSPDIEKCSTELFADFGMDVSLIVDHSFLWRGPFRPLAGTPIEEHHLVTTGPYARVRHPLYSAMVGIGISFALVTGNWVFVLLAALVIAGLVARVPREERMMIKEFGEEYKAYMQRTGRFFPK